MAIRLLWAIFYFISMQFYLLKNLKYQVRFNCNFHLLQFEHFNLCSVITLMWPSMCHWPGCEFVHVATSLLIDVHIFCCENDTFRWKGISHCLWKLTLLCILMGVDFFMWNFHVIKSCVNFYYWSNFAFILFDSRFNEKIFRMTWNFTYADQFPSIDIAFFFS